MAGRFVYEYHLKDHLGNLRLSVRPYQYGFYSEGFEDHVSDFQGVDIGRITAQPYGGNYSQKLNASNALTAIGANKVVRVLKGHKLEAQVYAKYIKNQSNSFSLGLFGTPKLGAGAGLEGSTLFGSGGSGVSVSRQTAPGTTTTSLPQAYLRVVFYDTLHREVSDSEAWVSSQSENNHSPLNISATAPSNGYALVYLANESSSDVFFDSLSLSRSALSYQENHYDPWGVNLVGIERSGVPDHKYQYNGKEKQEALGWYDHGARMYDPVVGRWFVVDPLADHPNQIRMSPYNAFWNNPIVFDDPDGRCPTCPTAMIGAFAGGMLSGGIEIGVQLYENGSVNNWKAVGGATLQGAITGGVAGFTGGASLLGTVGASGGANIVGGIANRAIQGQATTVADVAQDGLVGAGSGGAGKVIGNVARNQLNSLSAATKGKIGEAVTQVKYGLRGYVSSNTADVATSLKRVNGLPRVAKYDFAMKNIFTGKQLTVESKFNGARLTRNQINARSRVTTPGGLIIDRTTSSQLADAVKAAATGVLSSLGVFK